MTYRYYLCILTLDTLWCPLERRAFNFLRNMFDLKVINSVLGELEEERGIPREKVLEAIETALATAYNKEYGKRGRVVRAHFDIATGTTEFFQIKFVVDPKEVLMDEEEPRDEEDERVRYNEEKHIFIEDAKKMKKDVEIGDELVFPLEQKEDYGRIAAQTAKQVIIQKIREAEKASVLSDYADKEGEVVHGTVQRVERGNIYIDLGRATGIIPYDEQIPGERFRQGERVRALLYSVEEGSRGVFLRLSRSQPEFIKQLFAMEVPELVSGTVEIKEIAREPGSRTKLAVISTDEHIDPVGSLVGQRGARVYTVMSELGGEKIDVIEYSEDPRDFIEDALSPAKVLDVEINEDEKVAEVEVAEDQQSLAIGRGGQNVRLAAKLTGWKIDITSVAGETVAEADGDHVEVTETEETDEETEDTPEEEAAEAGETKEDSEDTPEVESEEGTPEASDEDLDDEGEEKES